ncbi:MAG: T9SS type A sorting domain-containing protein [Emticicia sp.]
MPNPKLWKNGGVNINNNFPINQPSVNVATFDSRNSAGIPYNFSNKFAYGSTDTLTSVAIDLSGLAVKDSVYLSFYWEAKGLGELPDSDDSLVVSFLNDKNQWKTIWRQEGISRDAFTQKILSVNKAEYLHKNFQFRFETRGRQSGAFDMWHVDFVYLNKQRRLKDIYTQDIALRGFKNSYLKRYSAMPLRQYLVNPSAETNNSMEVLVSALQRNARLVNFTWTVSDTVSKSILLNERGGNETVTTPNPPNKRNNVPVFSSFPQKQAVLKFTQKIAYEGTGTTVVPDSTNNIADALLLSNDSTSIYTPLLDYYAYDDGTAETGADTDQTLGKVAVKFALNKADTVNAVRFNFTPFFKDISGQFFLLQIMESAKGKPAKILHQQSLKVRYASDINGFVEYPLDMNIAVKDTFFVSWTKTNEDVIGVGVDKNSDFGSNIYYSSGNEWVQNKALKGSLMVRPVMGFKANGTGQNGSPLASEEPNDRQFVVFPNPTTGVLRWNFENIQSISIFDVSGKEIFYKEIDNQELNIENLPENIYYINFSDGKKNFIRKIVVVH